MKLVKSCVMSALWICVLVVAALCSECHAQTTWVGGNSGSWSTPDNWSGGVPDAGKIARLATPGVVITVDMSVDAESITVAEVARLDMRGVGSGVALPAVNCNSAAWLDILSGDTVFISGVEEGVLSGILINGKPAAYDEILGVVAAGGNTPLSLKALGPDVIPDDPDVAAVIDQLGSGGGITLEKGHTTIFSLRQEFGAETAYIDLAGGTLAASRLEIESDGGSLTLSNGGTLSSPEVLQGAGGAIELPELTAAPVIWFDLADSTTVTTDEQQRIILLANKGSAGSTLDAGVPEGWRGPLYVGDFGHGVGVARTDSMSVRQGLTTLGTMPISGKDARTAFIVVQRLGVTSQSLYAMFMGVDNSNQAFGFTIRPYEMLFMSFGNDITVGAPPAGLSILSFITGLDEVPDAGAGYINGELAGERTFQFDTAAAPLRLMNRQDTFKSLSAPGDLAEVVIYDYTLSSEEREAVESYLMRKWGIASGSERSHELLVLDNASDSAVLGVEVGVTDQPGSYLHLLKDGAGEVVIGGYPSYMGATHIADGTLVFDTPEGSERFLSGGIKGSGKLVKRGAGTLVAGGSGNYSGDIRVEVGILMPGHSSALGSGEIVVESGAALDLKYGGLMGSNLLRLPNRVVVGGSGPDGLGALRYSQVGEYSQQEAFKDIVLSDDLTIYADSRFDVRDGSFDFNGHSVTLKGGSIFALVRVDAQGVTPEVGVNIESGEFRFERHSFKGSAANLVTAAPGACVAMYDLKEPMAWSMSLADDAFVFAYEGEPDVNIWGGPVVLAGGTPRLFIGQSGNATLSGVVSGSGNLLKHGTGTAWLLNSANTYQGYTHVAEGTLYTVAPGTLGSSGIAGLSVSDSGTFVARVADDGWSLADVASIANSSTFVTPETTTLGVDSAEDDLIITHAWPNIGLAKYGPYKLSFEGAAPRLGGIFVHEGELDLSVGREYQLGENSVVVGATRNITNTAILRMDGSAVLTDDLGSNVPGPTIRVGYGANTRSLLYLDSESVLYGKLALGEGSGANGAIYQYGGVVTNSSGNSNTAIIGGAGYGYYRLESGELALKGSTMLAQGVDSVGIVELHGGRAELTQGATAPTGEYGSYYGGNIHSLQGVARLLVSGANLENNSHTVQLGAWSEVKSGGDSTLTIERGGSVTGVTQLHMTNRDGDAVANVNLNDGLLAVRYLIKGESNGKENTTQAFINFDGGVLRSVAGGSLVRTGSNNTPPQLLVYSGGAKVEVPDGQSAELSEPLQAPAGFGLAGVEITNTGEGYIGPPAVQISGGGGYGATALAEIDIETGELTSIRVTSPGRGYTSIPNVVLRSGGYLVAGSARALLGINSVEGGLTKLGGGSLELRGANSYGGSTEVLGGRLRLGEGSGGLSPRSEIRVSGGTLDLGGQTITNAGVVVVESGSLVNGNIVANGVVKQGEGEATFAAGVVSYSVREQREAYIRALEPLIWYDPADVSSLTLEGERVVAMQNKGILGATHDARPKFSAEINGAKYLAGGSSIAPAGAGVLHIADQESVMESSSNVPITGTAPRTLIAMLARSGSGAGNRGVVMIGSGAQGKTFEIGNSSDKTYLSGIAGDRDTDIRHDIPAVDQLVFVAAANGYQGNPVGGVTVWRSKGSDMDELSAIWTNDMGTESAPLTIGRRDSGNLFKGKVGAVLLFDRVLTMDELESVRDILVAQYLEEAVPGEDDVPAAVRISEGTLKLAASEATIAALNPILWYDPSDSDSVTLDGSGKVTGLANKGTMGTEMDAVVNITNGGVQVLPPGLVSGGSSYARSGLPMLSLTAANEGMGSKGNIGAMGSEPRTVAGIFARHNNSNAGPIVAFGKNATRQLYEIGDRHNGCTVGCFGGGNDLFMTPVNPVEQANLIIAANVESDVNVCWRSGVTPNYVELKISGDLITDDSRFMIGLRPYDKNRNDFRGQIGEVMVFDRLLSNEERELVSQYLSCKWLESGSADDYLAGVSFEVESGGVLDIGGGRENISVSGDGSIVNGRVGNGFVISPAGDAGIGILSFSGVTFGEGVTYRLTATATESDKIEVSGDLSGVTIVPAMEEEPSGSSYIVATGTITGKPALDGFPEKYKLILRGSELVLTREGGTLMLLR